MLLTEYCVLAVKGSEPDNIIWDPQRLMTAMRQRMPDHLVDAVMDFGSMDQSEMFKIVLGLRQFQGAMMQVVEDRNLLILV